MSQETDHFDQLPAAIIERLRNRDRSSAIATPDVDSAVRRSARAQFDRPYSKPAVRRWYYSAAAAAAAAIVAILIIRPIDADRDLAPDAFQPAIVADDVDASGRVDILDAFALARARAADPNTASQARIDALVGRIVSLSDVVL